MQLLSLSRWAAVQTNQHPTLHSTCYRMPDTTCQLWSLPIGHPLPNPCPRLPSKTEATGVFCAKSSGFQELAPARFDEQGRRTETQFFADLNEVFRSKWFLHRTATFLKGPVVERHHSHTSFVSQDAGHISRALCLSPTRCRSWHTAGDFAPGEDAIGMLMQAYLELYEFVHVKKWHIVDVLVGC